MEIRELLTVLKKEPMRRTFQLDRATVKATERTVDLAFSSELPYARWWGIEVLDHSKGAMRMDRAKDGIAVLFNHGRSEHLGIMSDCRCDPDKIGRGTARFGQGPLASEKLRDVEDGILKDVSVGYEIHFMKEMDPKEMTPDLMEMAAREKLPVYRITDWEPYECSFVTVPADPTVGVGRTAASPEGKTENDAVKPPTEKVIQKEERKMSDEKRDTGELAQIEADRKKSADAAASDAQAKERARCEDIHKYWYKFRDVIQEFVRDKAIREGMSVEQFRGIVLDRISDSSGSRPLDTPMGQIGLSQAEVKRYSLLRAVQAAANKEWSGAGFEKELSDAVAKKVGQPPRSFYLPYDIMAAQRSPQEMGFRSHDDLLRAFARALNVASDSAGGYLVGTQHMPGSFIELLRARLVAARAGVQIMSGLVGNVDIPKLTGASTAYWLSTETTDVTESAQTFGQVLLSPKSVGAYVDITRRLALQSSPAADNLVMNDIVRVLGLGIDLAVFHGTGADGQPTGIAGVASGSFTGTTFSWILAISAVTDVMTANADVPGMNWVCSPASWGILKTREKGTAGYPTYLCGDDDRMAGFPVLTSTQITAANLHFGDFTQAIIGEWGVLDMLVDTSSLSKSGGIRIVGFQSVDVAIRQAGAFTLATDLS